MKVNDALRKFCPFGFSRHLPVVEAGDVGQKCIGELCMAWKVGSATADLGYCKLIGASGLIRD